MYPPRAVCQAALAVLAVVHLFNLQRPVVLSLTMRLRVAAAKWLGSLYGELILVSPTIDFIDLRQIEANLHQISTKIIKQN
jgi:hypothetical protein